MIDPSNDDAGFLPNTKFNQIYQLFSLDRDLRNDLLEGLEEFEANLRQVMAYVISDKISANFDVYSKRENYRTGKKRWNPKKHKKTYPIDDLIEVFKKVCTSKEEPFRHYREDHDNIPPWIMVKKLSFGNTLWWFQLLKGSVKEEVVAKILGFPLLMVSKADELPSLIGSLLELYLDYRNTAAHGGRIYNHFSERHKLQYNNYFHPFVKVSEADYRAGKGQSRVGTLLKSLRLFENQHIAIQVEVSFNFHIQNYLKLNPDKHDYLSQEMEIDLDELAHSLSN